MNHRKTPVLAIVALLCLTRPAFPQVSGIEVADGATASVFGGKTPMVKVTDPGGKELALLDANPTSAFSIDTSGQNPPHLGAPDDAHDAAEQSPNPSVKDDKPAADLGGGQPPDMTAGSITVKAGDHRSCAVSWHQDLSFVLEAAQYRLDLVDPSRSILYSGFFPNFRSLGPTGLRIFPQRWEGYSIEGRLSQFWGQLLSWGNFSAETDGANTDGEVKFFFYNCQGLAVEGSDTYYVGAARWNGWLFSGDQGAPDGTSHSERTMR